MAKISDLPGDAAFTSLFAPMISNADRSVAIAQNAGIPSDPGLYPTIPFLVPNLSLTNDNVRLVEAIYVKGPSAFWINSSCALLRSPCCNS